MRLKNPIQGLKMASLNFLSHLTFYIVLVFFVTKTEYALGEAEQAEYTMQV